MRARLLQQRSFGREGALRAESAFNDEGRKEEGGGGRGKREATLARKMLCIPIPASIFFRSLKISEIAGHNLSKRNPTSRC